MKSGTDSRNRRRPSCHKVAPSHEGQQPRRRERLFSVAARFRSDKPKTANFTETQLKHMRPMQPAKVSVDTYGRTTLVTFSTSPAPPDRFSASFRQRMRRKLCHCSLANPCQNRFRNRTGPRASAATGNVGGTEGQSEMTCSESFHSCCFFFQFVCDAISPRQKARTQLVTI